MANIDLIPEAFQNLRVWLDGELIDGKAAMVPIMTHTLHYGLGVFEGIRSYEGEQGPAVFRLKEHIERLFRSAKMVRMEIPFTVDEICKACTDTLAENGLREGYLRPLVFIDDGKRGLSAMNNRIRVAIVAWPWGAYLGEEALAKGISAQIAGWTRMNPRSFMPKGKICGQYVNSIMAKRDALLAGYDEAILLDDDGFVSEASGENIFMVEGGRITTPPRSSPILEGITRGSIIEIARHLGIAIEAGRFPRTHLYTSDEIFLTGTAAEVTPVREVDGYQIGAGSRGPITERIQSSYFASVRGELDGFEPWLTPYKV
ncbi:MAG: branched-chain amino acid transaminase [Deltaproteobacteria bacterium]|nr:branched-chain amino acid transaminase [Deltaproteobacteria bacterium]